MKTRGLNPGQSYFVRHPHCPPPCQSNVQKTGCCAFCHKRMPYHEQNYHNHHHRLSLLFTIIIMLSNPHPTPLSDRIIWKRGCPVSVWPVCCSLVTLCHKRMTLSEKTSASASSSLTRRVAQCQIFIQN